MKITAEMTAALRDKVKPYLTEKRYCHTIAVEEEAESIAHLMLPDLPDREEMTEKIKAAALLHDITKKEDLEKQLQYCSFFGIMTKNELLESPKLFHAVTASRLIEHDFPEFADSVIVSCVRWHTTGHDGMTLPEAIVYLADYIEKTRTFPDCVELRRYFYDGISRGDEKRVLFLRTMVLSFDCTIRTLCGEGSPIDGDTVEARNYFIRMLHGGAGNF